MLTGIEIAKRYMQATIAEAVAVKDLIGKGNGDLRLTVEIAQRRGALTAYATVLELDEQTPAQAWLDGGVEQAIPNGAVAVERAGESPFYVLTGPGCGHPEEKPEIEAPAWFGFVTQAQLKALFYTIAEVLEAESVTRTPGGYEV